MSSIGIDVGGPISEFDEMNEQFSLGLETEAEAAGFDAAEEVADGEGGEEEEEETTQQRATAKFKILLTCIQISQALLDIIEVKWPNMLIDVTVNLSFINFSLPGIFK